MQMDVGAHLHIITGMLQPRFLQMLQPHPFSGLWKGKASHRSGQHREQSGLEDLFCRPIRRL